MIYTKIVQGKSGYSIEILNFEQMATFPVNNFIIANRTLVRFSTSQILKI